MTEMHDDPTRTGRPTSGSGSEDLDGLLAEMRREADAMAARDEIAWSEQRRAIRLRISEEHDAEEHEAARSWLGWRLAALEAAAVAVLALGLFALADFERPAPAVSELTPGLIEAQSFLAEVELALATPAGSSLAPAELLVAALEAELADVDPSTTDSESDTHQIDNQIEREIYR